MELIFNTFRNSSRMYCSVNGNSEILKCINLAKTTSSEIIFSQNTTNKVSIIGFNRPKSRNALGINLIEEFKNALTHIENDKECRCVIIGSLVPNVFCAGADLKERANIRQEDVGAFVKNARDLFQRVAEIPIPTICAIDGFALGGGLELALACDLRYASSNSIVGLVETQLGIIPGAGGTQRLPRIVGITKAKELIFKGNKINAEEARNIGIFTEVVEQNADGLAALLKAYDVSNDIGMSTGPIAIRAAKKAIDEGMKYGPVVTKEALLIEGEYYETVIKTEDRLEGLKAFKEKRKPKFQGK